MAARFTGVEAETGSRPQAGRELPGLPPGSFRAPSPPGQGESCSCPPCLLGPRAAPFFPPWLFPQWLSQGRTEASVYQQAENGKTELSLVHFAITNPRWQPPPESSLFIGHLKEKVQQDAAHAPPAQRLLAEAPLGASFLSDEGLSTVVGPRAPGSPDGFLVGGLAWPGLWWASPASSLSFLPRQPDALLASVLAHPVLAAGSPAPLAEPPHVFTRPSSTASAAASILASLSCSQLPRHSLPPGENSIYRSDSTILGTR